MSIHYDIFHRWMEASNITQPSPEDEFAMLGYIDELRAWAAEHDPDGWARWEESAFRMAVTDELDPLVEAGEATWGIDWETGDVVYGRTDQGDHLP